MNYRPFALYNKRFFLVAVFLLLYCTTAAHAEAIIANGKPITLIVKDTPLETCLREISVQAQIKFVYGNDIVNKIKMTCNIKKATVDEALRTILYPNKLNYKFTAQNQVTIFEDKTLKLNKKLSGVIIDSKTGERLPYAVISVDETGANTIANNKGEFLLQDTPFTDYNLTAKRIGYNTAAIFVNSVQEGNVVVKMDECEIMIEQIIIQAENLDVFRTANEAGTFSMSPRNNLIMPGIGVSDISRSLHSVPGLSAPSFGSCGLNIRGGIPSQNLLLLDGMSLYSMNHSFGFFNSFNSDAIKDVQVYKGGYPAIFGGRISGVVELTSKDGDFNNAHVDAGVNQMSAQGIAEIPLFGKGAILMSARRSISGFVLNKLYEKVYYAFRENFASFDPKSQSYSALESDIHFYDLLGKITYLPTNNNILTFTAFSGYDEFSNGRKETRGQAKLNENAETKNEGVSAKWYCRWDEKYNTTLMCSRSTYTNFNRKWWDNKFITDTVIVNKVSTNNNLTETKCNLDGQLLYESDELSIGAAYSEISTDFNFGLEYLPFYPDNAKQKLANDKVSLFSVYMQDKRTFFSCLNTIVGLRINRYKTSDKADYEPRFSVFCPLSKTLLLKAAVGKYYQYIMQYEDFANVLQGRVSWISADNDNVKPSSAWHYIFGAKYQQDDFTIDAELYYKQLNDVPETLYEWKLSDKIPLSNKIVQNDMRIKGFDLLLKKNAGVFFGWISYSYCVTETDYYIDNIKKTAPASNDTPHKLDIVLNMKSGSLVFSAAWHYISGKPYSIPVLQSYNYGDGIATYITEPKQYNSQRYPATHQLDFSVLYAYSYKFISGDFGLSIFNVYDNKNVWFGNTILKDGKLIQTQVYMLGFTPTLFLDITI